jgi:hypothetical protein
MSDEERGYEVIDKRGGQARNGGASSPSPAEEFVSAEADEDYEGGPPLEVTVQGVLRFAIEMLSSRAWVAMGLMPNPMNGKIDRNLDEARRAIDILGDLARHAEAEAEPEEKRDLRNTLADLRVNFIRQSNQPG